MVQVGPASTKLGPASTESRPTSTETWPNPTTFGPNWTEPGPKSIKVEPAVVELGEFRAGEFGPRLTKLGPTKFRPARPRALKDSRTGRTTAQHSMYTYGSAIEEIANRSLRDSRWGGSGGLTWVASKMCVFIGQTRAAKFGRRPTNSQSSATFPPSFKEDPCAKLAFAHMGWPHQRHALRKRARPRRSQKTGLFEREQRGRCPCSCCAQGLDCSSMGSPYMDLDENWSNRDGAPRRSAQGPFPGPPQPRNTCLEFHRFPEIRNSRKCRRVQH